MLRRFISYYKPHKKVPALDMSDEHFMKDAEQILYNEWQYVLNVDKTGLMDYIFSRIESSN